MTQTNATNGSNLTITYLPTSAGNHTATLAISGGGLASSYTITLSGTCCSTYTVTLSRNGITETIGACGTYTLPVAEDEADACDGWEFKGWTTSSSYSSTTAPSYVTEVSSATTVYAVYGKSEGGGGTVVYEKVTSLSNITAGTYIIINNSKYLPSTTTSSSPTQGTAPTVTNNQIASSDVTSAMLWTFSGTSYSAMSITNASGKYLFVNGSGNSNLRVGDTSDTWAFSTNSTGFSMVDASQSRYCATYAAGSDWRTYTTNHANYGDGGIVYLYKQTGGGGTTTYKTTPCTTYKVFYADANGEAAHGSYWADQTTATAGTTIELEADPADGYELTGWTVTKYGTSTTVEVTNDEFTMPECSVTVAATFAALSSHTVTFMNNGATYASRSGYTGSAISAVPDPTACEGYTFVGWSTVTQATEATSNPSTTTPTTIPSADATYYAVYSREDNSGSGASTDYELYSGTLTEGDYVIYYDGYAMKAIVSSERLSYTSVTPSDNKISSPDADIIWHIAASGDYWTIYNTDAASYAAGTGAKNKAQLLADGTDNKSLWTVSGTSTYEFVNKANTAASVNATLRNNGTYGFACYSTQTGGALSLYKNTGSSSTTYYTTSPNCCTATLTVQSPDDTMGTVSIE